MAGRQEGSERRGEREEGGARREVEVWNGSVVAVPRLGSHACLRFRVVACLCSRVYQFAFSPSFSLSLLLPRSRSSPSFGFAGRSLSRARDRRVTSDQARGSSTRAPLSPVLLVSITTQSLLEGSIVLWIVTLSRQRKIKEAGSIVGLLEYDKSKQR